MSKLLKLDNPINLKITMPNENDNVEVWFTDLVTGDRLLAYEANIKRIEALRDELNRALDSLKEYNGEV